MANKIVAVLIALVILVLSWREVWAKKQSYVVYLGGYHGGEVGHEQVAESHYELVASVLGSKTAAKDSVFYSYSRTMNGFAAYLEKEHAHAISELPEVVALFPNRERKLHTTHSWKFLGLEKGYSRVETEEISPVSLWKKAKFGKDIIIANMDTGVWPESASFDDTGFGPVPSRWRGSCQNVSGFNCNRKLIGASYFYKGFETENGPLNLSQIGPLTPRDENGHGSHTLSTAGGNFVKNASIFGSARGIAKGGAPHARVAAYKVCWEISDGTSCYDADILAAFDVGIYDGVDVFCVSLGESFVADLLDAISIGSLHAVQRGKMVVASAGNEGPILGSVGNVAPWIMTVGASSIDRSFSSFVFLGNKNIYKGHSLSQFSLKKRKLYPLINASDARRAGVSESDGKYCILGDLDPKKVRGKIVACLRGVNGRIEKGEAVRREGGVGMILCNSQDYGNDVSEDLHVISATHLNAVDGAALFHYINSTVSPVAYIIPPRTLLNTKPAPVTASFSSLGPNLIVPDILKPDITAPGLNILAAWAGSASPTGFEFDHRQVPFNIISGTSMSCPHVAGVVALLKAAFPHWSSAAIRSAIMTTATRMDNTKAAIKKESGHIAGPFDYGAGHINPTRASKPGLVYDLSFADYLTFLCSFGFNSNKIKIIIGKSFSCPPLNESIYNLNYPSITVSHLNTTVFVKRTVTYVSKGPAVFKAKVQSPHGVSAAVKPNKLEFLKTGEKKSFYLVMKPKKNFNDTVEAYSYGSLTWKDAAQHVVRSPIVVCKAGAFCLPPNQDEE